MFRLEKSQANPGLLGQAWPDLPPEIPLAWGQREKESEGENKIHFYSTPEKAFTPAMQTSILSPDHQHRCSMTPLHPPSRVSQEGYHLTSLFKEGFLEMGFLETMKCVTFSINVICMLNLYNLAHITTTH